jgi:lipopolysaccharide/colanic/teichoic acid biosynthesis glycosyltransferase
MHEFQVMKFRTMSQDASPELHRQYIAQLMTAENEDDDGLKKLTNDPRVTRVGAFLRKTSLDELPQLLNVVAGQMSLVGPRPALGYELDHYDAVHFDRFQVRPGLTGLWQVSGRSELGFRQMLDLDAQYARESSPVQDLQILLKTPITLLRRHAA